MQETMVEKHCRAKGKFPEVEAELPVLRSRRQSSFIDKVSSLLGERNPLARPVNPRSHAMWLLDTTAFRTDKPDEWSAEVVAAYFIKGSGKDSAAVVAKISELIGLAEDDEARKKVAERLRPFLDAVLPAHTAQYEIDSQTYNERHHKVHEQGKDPRWCRHDASACWNGSRYADPNVHC